jgi:hypothetical protein
MEGVGVPLHAQIARVLKPFGQFLFREHDGHPVSYMTPLLHILRGYVHVFAVPVFHHLLTCAFGVSIQIVFPTIFDLTCYDLPRAYANLVHGHRNMHLQAGALFRVCRQGE